MQSDLQPPLRIWQPSLSNYSAHTDPVENTTPCYVHSTTHTRQISLFLPLSQPPTLSQGTSVWLLCAIFWCDILSCALILYSLCMCATRCVCGGFLVWRGANALGLWEDSSVLLMEAGWKFLSLATMWSGQAETGRERQRSHSSSSTIVSCQQLLQKVQVMEGLWGFLPPSCAVTSSWPFTSLVFYYFSSLPSQSASQTGVIGLWSKL